MCINLFAVGLLSAYSVVHSVCFVIAARIYLFDVWHMARPIIFQKYRHTHRYIFRMNIYSLTDLYSQAHSTLGVPPSNCRVDHSQVLLPSNIHGVVSAARVADMTRHLTALNRPAIRPPAQVHHAAPRPAPQLSVVDRPLGIADRPSPTADRPPHGT